MNAEIYKVNNVFIIFFLPNRKLNIIIEKIS